MVGPLLLNGSTRRMRTTYVKILDGGHNSRRYRWNNEKRSVVVHLKTGKSVHGDPMFRAFRSSLQSTPS